MLPSPIFDIADRLVTTLTTLVGALVALITPQTNLDSPEYAAHSFLRRLVALIATTTRLDLGDTPRKSATRATAPAASSAPRDHTPSPRRPRGWLLEFLPDLAPTIAADLAAILADPAFATLLATAPTIHRSLRPFLRALDLTLPTPSTPDATPPDAPPPPAPNHPSPVEAAPAATPLPTTLSSPPKNSPPNLQTLHAQFVT